LADIRTILQGQLGDGDAQITKGRQSLSSVIDGYENAIKIYNSIVPDANKYIEMAKALGETTILSNLEKIKKDAQTMIKASEGAISKLKSI
jgi:hypothetical protein